MIPSGSCATVFPCAGICLGIDPDVDDFDPGSTSQRRVFESRVENHARMLEACPRAFPIKPNLAFFLRFGSWGLGLLESFCTRVGGEHPVLLDAKFNEISLSLECYLDFAFGTLRAQAITLNPFLGEKTIAQAVEACQQATGGFGRVYVLCATSQWGESLAKLQDASAIIEAVALLGRSLGPSQEHSPLGLVVGAARHDVLDRPDLRASGLPLLCPGLGPQGADWAEAAARLHSSSSNSLLYPLSRYIFDGGRHSADQALGRLQSALDRLAGSPNETSSSPQKR